MGILSREPAYQAYVLLRIVFVALPLVAGIDKFFNYLVDWSMYLEPALGDDGKSFVYLVGLVEILIGLGVFIFPRIFANIVALWLALVIINLMNLAGLQKMPMGSQTSYFPLRLAYYDVVLRDLGLFFSALALGRLAKQYG